MTHIEIHCSSAQWTVERDTVGRQVTVVGSLGSSRYGHVALLSAMCFGGGHAW